MKSPLLGEIVVEPREDGPIEINRPRPNSDPIVLNAKRDISSTAC
jgi:hypothetical protein